MTLLVSTAFNKFRQLVDIEPEQTRRARSSRTFLTDRITALSRIDASFPKVTGRYIPFGSFARKTKINPLDDIDVLMLLTPLGIRPANLNLATSSGQILMTSSTAALAPYADLNGNLNSIRILNRIKGELSKLHTYRYSAIKRNQQAVTLLLKTQPWAFDIVPALPVVKMRNGVSMIAHYLIPNGAGGWMPTDPRKNAADITRVNVRHQSLFLPTVRLIKHWNGRGGKARLGSFYIETLAMRVFEKARPIVSIPQAIAYFFEQCPAQVCVPCPSPTGHGPHLDRHHDTDAKQKIVTAMQQAANASALAMQCVAVGDHKGAISYWRRVFGSEFPNYV